MRMLRIALLAVLASGICNAGHAEFLELPATDIRDIYRSDPGRINLHFDPGRIVPVSLSLGATNARIGIAVAAEELDLDIGALVAASTDGDSSENYFSLVIEGSEYVLDVVEAVFDPVFGMRHVLAAVVYPRTPEAYARFTFDPESGSVAGTLVSGARRYRIVSRNNGGTQLVFPLRSAETDPSGLVTSGGLVASAVAHVERRHVQAERIAEIKPYIFSQPENGFTTRLVGGAIGNVDVDRLDDSQVIARLLMELSVFTRASGDEEFEILSLDPTEDGGRRVTYRQLIVGIPVNFKSTLYVGPDGSVQSLLTRVVNPSGVSAKLVSEQEAQKIATDLIEREIGHRGIVKIDLRLPELEYDARPTSQEEYGTTLTPTWHVRALVTTTTGPSIGESALIVINAETAEASVQQNRTLY